MRGKYIEIDKNLLLETYKNCGRSLNQTGKVLGIPAKTIKRRFVEYGLEYDKKVEYSCNEDFFNDLNEKSMYWLGFLATDGNVYKHNYSYTLSIKLATKDIDHLKELKTHIGFTGPIRSYIDDSKKMDTFKQSEYYNSQISITSKKIFKRLADFNIIPDKTHIIQFPQQLKDHPFLNHFIRGCIDGDGWVREHCNNGSETPTEVRIGMCGTEKFVRETFSIIKEKLGIGEGYIGIKSDKNVTFEFEFSALHDVDRLVDWLYQDATVFLQRKYKIAKQAKGYAARYDPFVISKEQLERDYQEHGSIRQLAEKYEVVPQTVKDRLVKFDIEHRTIQAGEYNHAFFSDSNETEAKYYWSGFLAGKSTYTHKNNKPYLAFNCNDEEVIKSFLESSQMKLHITQLHKKDGSINYQINIFDLTIMSQLEKFGINDQKWDNYAIPEWLLDHPMLSHFLRGYLDARSSLTLYKGKLSLNIKNSRQFLEQIGRIFAENCSMPLTAKTKDTGKGSCQVIYLTRQAQAILGYLYRDATIYLPRKQEIAMMVK